MNPHPQKITRADLLSMYEGSRVRYMGHVGTLQRHSLSADLPVMSINGGYMPLFFAVIEVETKEGFRSYEISPSDRGIPYEKAEGEPLEAREEEDSLQMPSEDEMAAESFAVQEGPEAGCSLPESLEIPSLTKEELDVMRGMNLLNAYRDMMERRRKNGQEAP